MEGFGTDEQRIIDILTARSNDQRQEIAMVFSAQYGRNLILELESELSGKFEDVILALMEPPTKYLSKQIHETEGSIASYTISANQTVLVEILCTKTNDEIKKIVKSYEDLYNPPLTEPAQMFIDSDHFRRLITLILDDVQDESTKIIKLAKAMEGVGEYKQITRTHIHTN